MSAGLHDGARVLVRVPDWLGDLVMSEPTLRALDGRVRELDGALTLAGSPRLLEVLGDALPQARRVDASAASAWRGHDVALLLVNSFRSAWCAARAGIPRRVGWSRNLRGWLLSDALAPAREVGGIPLGLGLRGRYPRHLPRPFGAKCVELAGALGVAVVDTRPRLQPSAHGLDALRQRFASFGLAPDAAFVLANVGARAGSAKAYPPEHWSAALNELSRQRGEALVLVAGPGEEEALERVAGAVAGAHACRAPLADLRELVALCAAARLVLTADAGPRHVALASGTPLVVIAGPSDPRHTADHTARTQLLRVEVPCGPCHRELCRLTGAAHHACMRGVEPGEVARAARDELGRSR